MRYLAIFLSVGFAGGQTLPKIGEMLDTAGSARPVFGVAGNFLVGAVDAANVVSEACSERLCLTKTASTIRSATGETDSPPGPAIFGLDGTTAIVYFPQTRTFARWHDDMLDPLDWVVDREVLSIGTNEIGASQIAVRRGDTVVIVTPDGAILDSLPSPSGPVLLLSQQVLFTDGDSLVLKKPNASELRFDLPGAISFSPLSAHYAEIRAGSALYALRIDAGREHLFQLPGSQP